MTTPLCHTPVPACMHSVGRRATRMRLQLQRCMPNIHIFGTQTPKAASLERKALSTQPGSTSPVRNRQVHEWRHLTLCAALPMQASEQLRKTTNAQELQKGLAWEMHNGYINTQGRQAFSHFAAEQFQQLEHQIPLPLQKSACQKLIKGFDSYPRLPHFERIELVRIANNCLSAWLRSNAFLQTAPISPSAVQLTNSEQLSPDLKQQASNPRQGSLHSEPYPHSPTSSNGSAPTSNIHAPTSSNVKPPTSSNINATSELDLLAERQLSGADASTSTASLAGNSSSYSDEPAGRHHIPRSGSSHNASNSSSYSAASASSQHSTAGSEHSIAGSQHSTGTLEFNGAQLGHLSLSRIVPSTDQSTVQLLVPLHVPGVGTIPQSALPQPASVIQPHVQPLGCGEQQPTQATPPPPNTTQTQTQTHAQTLHNAVGSESWPEHPQVLDNTSPTHSTSGSSLSSDAHDASAMPQTKAVGSSLSEATSQVSREDVAFSPEAMPNNAPGSDVLSAGVMSQGMPDSDPLGIEATAQQASKKVVKAATIAFRDGFAQSAASADGSTLALDVAGVEQRSAAWMAMRDGRLTASSFANALGLFDGRRETLWAEKLGLVPRFAGNAATQWGTNREALALGRYEEITGQQVEACSFRVLRDDEVHGWLGASPDGLVQGMELPLPAVGNSVTGESSLVQGVGAGVFAGDGAGVLEIKCPFNKGDPNSATPPKLPQWYYMPQVQGLLDIFDRDWCNLYVWTINGSTLFHIQRDKDYWRLCFQVLAEFWWSHVIPAKHALARNDADAVDHYRPQVHPSTAQIKLWSRKMAKDALSTSFPPSQEPSRRTMLQAP